MEYNSKDIEKWKNFWSENQSFEPSDDKTKEKKYILSMFHTQVEEYTWDTLEIIV